MATAGAEAPARRRLLIAAGAAAAFLAALGGAGCALASQDPTAVPRRRMVEEQIRWRGIADRELLSVMEGVPRHLFVPEDERPLAYADHPLPIGAGQTISQPYVVALMTSLLGLDREDKVLEIGTGSGYQAAVLARLARDVYTIEIVPELAENARRTLAALGYANVHVKTGDGYRGWPEAAPFDAIILTAAPAAVPDPLLAQLKTGGKMVLPLGKDFQDLVVLTKTATGVERQVVAPVRFVPMTGEAEKEPPAAEEEPPERRMVESSQEQEDLPMYTLFKLRADELDERFLETLKRQFQDREIEIVVCESADSAEDETAYLLRGEPADDAIGAAREQSPLRGSAACLPLLHDLGQAYEVEVLAGTLVIRAV
jgi:protein-L-isoaspartate(D-aspartate) O-methyltransferase